MQNWRRQLDDLLLQHFACQKQKGFLYSLAGLGTGLKNGAVLSRELPRLPALEFLFISQIGFIEQKNKGNLAHHTLA